MSVGVRSDNKSHRHTSRMKRPAILAAVLALACVLLICAVVAGKDAQDGSDGEGYGESTGDAETYSILYYTDGGTLPDDAPEYYIAGCSMTFPVPEREGYVFAGWYSDRALKYPKAGVTETSTGLARVYAKWVEGSEVGTGWTMEVSGRYATGSVTYTVTGTVRYGYDASSGGALLLRTESAVTYSGGGDEWTSERSSSSWISALTGGWTYTGNRLLDGEYLTVWTDGSSTMWVRDMTVIVWISTPYGVGTIEQTLVETAAYEPAETFLPNVTAEYPVSVSGVEEAGLGEDVTLTAAGDGFGGWYLNGELVSTDPTHTFALLSPSDRIVAATTVLFTVVEDGSEIASLGFGGATVTDSDGNAVSDLWGIGPGAYSCVLYGDVTTTAEFVVEDSRTFSVEWEYGGATYSYETTVLYSDVLRFDAANPDLARFNKSVYSEVERLCTWYDRSLADVAGALRGMGSGLDEVQFAEFVLKFVQAVPYVSDLESRGSTDYWKIPLETLWDGCGDCEDLTVLYITLMGMLGYRTAFLMFDGHTMAAVSLDADGWTVTVEGCEFLMCETTNSAFSVGDTSGSRLPGDVVYSCRLECFPADFHL